MKNLFRFIVCLLSVIGLCNPAVIHAYTPVLTQVHIDPGAIDGYQIEYRLSALAYDQFGQPLWSDVTYDWGISSNNSIGTFTQVTGSIANFDAQNAGNGSLFVTATYQEQTVTGSIPVTILPWTTIYRIQDITNILSWYASSSDQYFYLKDDKVNMFDIGYIIGHLSH